jgi:hypothetical protein
LADRRSDDAKGADVGVPRVVGDGSAGRADASREGVGGGEGVTGSDVGVAPAHAAATINIAATHADKSAVRRIMGAVCHLEMVD